MILFASASGDGDAAGYVGGDITAGTQELLLKELEAQIETSFLLVAAARSAYGLMEGAEGDAALAKASENLGRSLARATASPVVRVNALRSRLAELQAGIDEFLEAREAGRGKSATGQG